jgi:predicted alpha/beta-hydrolase family hydrolase
MAPSPQPFHVDAPGQPPVRGVLHPARHPVGGIVLTHGAGGDCHAPLLVALATAFAEREVMALRCDLPFRQVRRRGPPSAAASARDRDGLRHAVLALRRSITAGVFLGGHSYGGRQASMLGAAEPALVEALLLTSYPLHPPGRPDRPRTEHLPSLLTPSFFVHGTRDAFGSVEALRAAVALVPARTGLLVVEGGHHDLAARGAVTGLATRIASAFLDWWRGAAPGGG